MDKLRVFVSSTCYDLKQIRRDLEQFIESMGFEPVMSDSKHVAIPSGLSSLEACKWLVSISDVFVLVIGGRYGSMDKQSGKSITNIEYETAYEMGKPIYAFVDCDVWNLRENYQTMRNLVASGGLSKDKLLEALGNKVEDERIFDFLEQVAGAKHDNWIGEFSTAADILGRLKNQWSLLFKRAINLKRSTESTLPTAGLMPRLYLEWGEGELIVPALLENDPSQFIEHLQKVLPPRELLQDADSALASLKELHSKVEMYQTPRLNTLIHRFRSVQQFAGQVEELKAKAENDFDSVRRGLNIANRLLPLEFVVLNQGTCPAKGIIVRLHNAEKVRFVTLDSLGIEQVEMPKAPEELASLADDLALARKAQNMESEFWAPRSLNLADPNVLKGMRKSHSLDMLSQARETARSVFSNPADFIQPCYLPVTEFRMPDLHRDMEITGFGVEVWVRSLRHHFTEKIEDKGIKILVEVEKGQRVEVQYECFADNLPQPQSGTLTVLGT